MNKPLQSEISGYGLGGPDDDSDPVTVLLAGVRPSVLSALEDADDIAVVGNVGVAGDILRRTARRAPEVVVLDPAQAGVAAADNVVEQLAARANVLVLTRIDDNAAVGRAFRAGALGYLIADVDDDQVPHGVQVVASGGLIVGRSIARRFSAWVCAGHAPYPFPQLTAREQDVLERIAAGKSNKAIARELALAPKTVSNRVSIVFGKLGVAHRAQAIVVARDAGLGRG